MALKIAIVGAGPAGCMLARLLQHSDQAHNIDVKIYEGESSINYRSQGGTLDLHVKSTALFHLLVSASSYLTLYAQPDKPPSEPVVFSTSSSNMLATMARR